MPHTPNPSFPWHLRDTLAAASLFLATAAVVLWQNAHLVVLWDLSYTLDSSLRIALGQMPYRDFPFVHAPLTFLIQAAIIRLTGRVFFHHVFYAALIGGLGTVLAWRITLHTLRSRIHAAWSLSLLLAVPLTVLGIYSILPVPSYDCDTAFSILIAIFLLQRVSTAKSRLVPFATGIALTLPLFFKQNIGLPLLAVAIAAILFLIAIQLLRKATIQPLLAILTGAITTLTIAALLIHFTAGIHNYIYWTIQFAMQRRLPGLPIMLGIYQQPSLIWMLLCIAAALILLHTRLAKFQLTRLLALALLSAPFLWTLISLFLSDDADDRADSLLALWPLLLLLAATLTIIQLFRSPSLRTAQPLILLAAIHGTLLSQQIWGSTYAIWPLLILLIAEMIVFLDAICKSYLAIALTIILSATLLICGTLYTASEERLSYVQLPDEPLQHATFPALAGMATPGTYLPNFEELLRYAAANIPANDGILLLPGEDPFYFASGRTPQFPVLLFDPATDPYSPSQLVAQARDRHIRWLILKHTLQIKQDVTPQRDDTLQLLLQDFTLHQRLAAYDIYQRR
jgi:hypothetical protein